MKTLSDLLLSSTLAVATLTAVASGALAQASPPTATLPEASLEAVDPPNARSSGNFYGVYDAYVQKRVASGMRSYAERNRPGSTELSGKCQSSKSCGNAGSGAKSPRSALLRNDSSSPAPFEG
jgi:hypothetical protein